MSSPTAEPGAADAPVLASPSLRKPVLLVALLVGCVLLVHFTPLRDVLSASGTERLRAAVQRCGGWAPVAFVALNALGVSVGLPRLVFAALGGALFGWLAGSALAVAGTLVGCWVTFSAARALGRETVEGVLLRRHPRALALLDGLGRHGVAANLMIRLAPVGNCFAANLVMGVSSMGVAAFLVGTGLGIVPETVIYALFGSAVEGQLGLRLLTGGGALLLLAGVYALWMRRSSAAPRRLRGARAADVDGSPST